MNSYRFIQGFYVLNKILFSLLIMTGLLYATVPTQENVTKLYISFFDRAPDSAGLNYWVNQSNISLEEITQSFFGQTETKEKYPTELSDSEFIVELYKNLFKHEPDNNGFNYWLKELQNGKITRSFFILALNNGAKGDDALLLNNKTKVGLEFAEAGKNDLEEAKKIIKDITVDLESVNKALCDAGLEECQLHPSPVNEPYFKYQWYFNAANSVLENKGYDIDPNADIHIEEAWNITKGSSVKVAVIDVGFVSNHEDLAANVVGTYNADTGSSDVSYDGNFDEAAHGSTVAGFIAAVANDIGVAGVAPEAKLILIKSEEAADANTIKAFEYAKSQGVKVINCSWGTEHVSQAVSDELKSLYDAGITVVFASGNDGKDLDINGINDESELPWVIGVGASGESNDVTVYSNYGREIDILAPGGDAQDSIGVLGLDDPGSQGSDNQQGLVNNNYVFVDGTSFSCPIVTGTVALMYSVNPTLTPQRVREILIHSADKIGNTSYDANGFDSAKKRAYGKLNVTQAVTTASQ